MIHKIQIFILVLLIPLVGIYLYTEESGVDVRDLFSVEVDPIAVVGGVPLKVEIVDSPEERSKGLSGRTDMGKWDGMLFVFDESDYHRMWMKDMYFPIDIIWINEDLVVVRIEEGVQPDSYPQTFAAHVPVRYAIETMARYADTFGIAEGAKVKLPKDVKGPLAD